MTIRWHRHSCLCGLWRASSTHRQKCLCYVARKSSCPRFDRSSGRWWQTFDIIFLAPRFNEAGKKIANAKIAKAMLNGQVIHDNQELLTPTGDRWKNAEMREGPLMLQADHGPVAFRNLRVRDVK